MGMENLLTLIYDSTHYYLVPCRDGWLQVDAGMPGSLPKLKSQLRRVQVDPAKIRYVMMTHHHPDHAGIIQEIKNDFGAKLVIHEKQVPYLADLGALFTKKGGYTPIVIAGDDILINNQNRAVLKSIGILGEIVETPGHSDDSVSLVLDSGVAFTGDLNLPYSLETGSDQLLYESWKKLVGLNVQRFYPAHANPVQVTEIQSALRSLLE